MAGNEATTSQTELWSSLVHQPCEDPEESELPSTVDMAAFSSGLTAVDPSSNATNHDHSDSDTDSELDSSNSSQSCTQSDSSDSDTSTSSVESSSSRSPSPEFSVTPSQTNGLRLTIATVRKSCSSPCNSDKMLPPTDVITSADSDSESEESSNKVKQISAKDGAVKKSTPMTTSTRVLRTRTHQAVKKKENAAATKRANHKTRQRKGKKMASLPISRGSTYNTSSDDSDEDSDRAILASCSLQEIRQEDLAAILPDQQECDAFGDFECTRTDKNSPQTGDLSGSDMELPQQAVNALIQRTTESSSDAESHPPPNPNTLHVNSLLQQFAAQTQLLNAPPPIVPPPVVVDSAKIVETAATSCEGDVVKRKRGRPRKCPKSEYCVDPNVSPDSGIQNSPDHVSSPEPTTETSGIITTGAGVTNTKTKNKKDLGKLSVTSNRFDRLLYGNTDRVLYPVRRKVGRPVTSTNGGKKGPGRPAKAKAAVEMTQQPSKVKFATLKSLKVVHSRHKHKKHKKLKFKILKAISNEPKVAIEIDKLVDDFVKCCVIGAVSKETSLVETKQAKKVSKKRKTCDNNERKKKKVNANNATVVKVTLNNEQRLPLKKRHYLFSDGKSNVKLEGGVEEEDVTSNNNTMTTPKKRHRLEVSPDAPSTVTITSSSSSVVHETIAPLYGGNDPVMMTSQMMIKHEIKDERTSSGVNGVEKKKVRKRRAINRTGFPTIKRKKKNKLQVPVIVRVTDECDRVPKDGEECDRYIERCAKFDDDDLMSECDSLPQDERIVEIDKSDDLDEISLEASIERLRSRLDKKKRKRSCEKIVDNLNGYPKRRLRDVSPSSSVERRSASGDEVKKHKRAPRWKKKYLVAGLFSDYFKEDDDGIRQKRNESRLVYTPAEHPYGLLPPPYHCGRYLRCRKMAFQLPHDLWWQHRHSQLPGRDVVPSWNYRKIRTNVYNVKLTTGACGEAQSCNCTSNCGDDCINRLVLAECPASHKCHNQRIQKHEWAPGLEKFMTVDKGWGVRTKLPIKSGEFILEYVGEVVSDQEFKQRMATIYVNDTHHYCLHLDGGLVIDGHRMGGDGRFVNHSCRPNCEIQKWSVNGQFRMALFALCDVTDGEELTYDYNFSLFNPAEGQQCKCGSDNCRGVIGGKSQRVRQLPIVTSGRVGRPRKNQAKRTTNNVKDEQPPMAAIALPHFKPVSHQQKCFIFEHHCFLIRNLSKVRKLRDRPCSTTVARQQTPTNQSACFINHLNALEKPRNIKTRRFAQAEDDPELNKTVKLAGVLRDIWSTVTKARNDGDGDLLSSTFMLVPSKRKLPEFHQRIHDPIDLNTIEQNIATGYYTTPDSFDSDMNRMFTNCLRFYGRTSEEGVAAIRLKKIYADAKRESLTKFADVFGRKPPATFVSNTNKNEEEDIIRCICGMPRDEGLMIQCERCMVWQHSECVKADTSADSYHCEICVPRDVDYEIPLDEFTEHGHRYYMTLLRDDLQLRQGDTVYVLRDIPIAGTDKKHTYETIDKIDYSQLDIFRIERLWKDSSTGQRFAYGHHYLRPHETYHEPTRKFFPNEVMRVPLYEAVPVELVISHCWVMDVNTFCKGRPIGAPEEHIYICEYRVDKSARLFSKVSKSKFPICTKSFIFERFESRLKVSRTYTPHDLDPALVKPRGRKPQDNDEQKLPIHVQIPVIRTPAEQKARLNKILLNLLGKMPTKQPLDVSYLLEGGRRRKKQPENLKS